jgi:hypothetical protein
MLVGFSGRSHQPGRGNLRRIPKDSSQLGFRLRSGGRYDRVNYSTGGSASIEFSTSTCSGYTTCTAERHAAKTHVERPKSGFRYPNGSTAQILLTLTTISPHVDSSKYTNGIWCSPCDPLAGFSRSAWQTEEQNVSSDASFFIVGFFRYHAQWSSARKSKRREDDYRRHDASVHVPRRRCLAGQKQGGTARALIVVDGDERQCVFGDGLV